MKRFIDESKIKFTGETFTDDTCETYVRLSDVRQAIAQTPTADVVEVVRCKDCKNYNGHRYCHYYMETVLDDDFCSYGERGDT